MNDLPAYYETPSYFRYLIKEYLLGLIKKSKNLSELEEVSPLGFLEEQGYDVSESEKRLLETWISCLLDLKYIEDILLSTKEDGEPEEVILHGHKWLQLIGKDRKEFFTNQLNQEDFQFSLEIFSLRHGVLWNQSCPFKCFKVTLFEKDWRVSLSHHSLSADGVSKMFLRAQSKQDFSLNSFGVTAGQEDLIQKCLDQKKNIIVCGATGSGKTTFLKSLLKLLPEREHIITLEDTSELSPASSFATQLLGQNQEGHQLKDYCHYALRMRPDRLILGEIRSAEVVPFLLSINTGHGGMMASLHANSGLDSLQRLCLLFQIYCGQMNISYHDVLRLVCQGVDFVFFLNHKRIESIIEVKGCEGMTPYYELWN